MPTPQLIVTVMPDRTLRVSLRNANETPSPLPPIPADLDWRLARFVDAMQALARERLGSMEDSARRQRAIVGSDNQPAASEVVNGKSSRK